jgi:hypothetical protein
MNTINKICSAIVILLVIYLISLEFNAGYYGRKVEGFKSKEPQTFQIKKTMKYQKVYGCSTFSIWCPVHIDNYFPIYHVCCKGSDKPTTEAILVKEDTNGKDLPKGYELIGVTKDDFSIWKPIPKKGYVAMGHIFSKKKPSKFAIRCVKEKYTLTDRLKNTIVSEKTLSNQKYSLWGGFHSSSFLCSELNGNNVPADNLFYIKDSLLNVEESLEMKYTSKYEKIFEKSSETTHISIWKPLAPRNYRCVGFISLANGVNPNGVLKTPVLHKKHCRKPINYGETYFGKISDNKDQIYTFWKPKPPSGYGCLSNLIVKDVDEPENPDIYAVSLDYLKSNPYSRNMIWNNLPNTHNMISIWTNKNDFFHASTKLNNPTSIDFNIDMKFVKLDKDSMDLSKDIVLNYKLNLNNTDVYDEIEREELIKKTLAGRFDIDSKRLANIVVDEHKKKINISVINRNLNSGETTVNEFIDRLSNTLEKDPIKIYNRNKNNYISKINDIQVIYKNIKDIDNIPLDITNFQESLY